MNAKTEGESPDAKSRLVLREWQVWHTYTSAYRDALPDLAAVAANLVRWGVADCAIDPSGRVHYYPGPRSEDSAAAALGTSDVGKASGDRPGRGVKHQLTRSDQRTLVESATVSVSARFDRNAASVQISQPVTSWALLAINSWAQTRLAEVKLFGESPLLPPYVWAQLGACTLFATQEPRYRLIVYPVLKIFDTGVVIVQLRMLSPERPVPVDDFIRRFVNAPMQGFNRLTVPPGLAAWARPASLGADAFKWYQRPIIAYSFWSEQREIARHTQIEQMGPWQFEQANVREAREKEAFNKAMEEAEPAVVHSAREAIIAAAAMQGVHLTQDLQLDRVDAELQRLVAEKLKSEKTATDQGGSDAPELPGDPPEPNAPSSSPEGSGEHIAPASEAAAPQLAEEPIVDWERLEADVRHMTKGKAFGLGREVVHRLLNTPGEESLSGLAHLVMQVSGYVATGPRNGPRRGFALAMLGPARRNDLMSYWAGRPHTHLFRFNDQAKSAKQNEERHRDDFSSILARIPLGHRAPTTLALPPSSRSLDDFGAYLGLGGTLWVHGREDVAKKGEHRKAQDHSMQVHDHQVKVELLEYGLALHHKIADRALALSTARPDEVDPLLLAQKHLAEFEWAVQTTGRFGEIRDLLERGWEVFGLPRLRQRIMDAIRVRQDLAAHRRGVFVTRWTTFIALIAGFLAVPPLVDVVVGPLWSLLGLWRPRGDDAYSLLLSGVALSAMGLLMLLGYLWARTRRSEV